MNRFLVKQAANAVLRYKLKRAFDMQAIKDKLSDSAAFAKKNIVEPGVAFSKAHLLLPALGAGVSGIATLIGSHKTKTSLKDKLKLLVHNATLGAMVGGGLELGRVGIKNILHPKDTIDGNPIVDGNFVED